MTEECARNTIRCYKLIEVLDTLVVTQDMKSCVFIKDRQGTGFVNKNFITLCNSDLEHDTDVSKYANANVILIM